MLSGNPSFRRLHLLSKKKTKVEPKVDKSLDDLAHLVKRLSVQIDDLETRKEEHPPPPVPASPNYTAVPSNYTAAPSNYTAVPSNYTAVPSNYTAVPSNHTLIDPWASYVPQNYAALLQKLEDMERLQQCPNACCAPHIVSSADGVPWPKPIEPFQSASVDYSMLDTHYTHWCTLLRCLPLMDPVTSAQVKTVGLYAMREILKCKANQKRDIEPVKQVTIRDSLSCSNLVQNTPLEEEVISPSRNRFQKWVQYKKTTRKVNTDTVNTPLNQSQTFRKIGSWFF